ncbi:MAG: adenosylcobinamide-phosphate synthase CbiB [Pseudomonadota bacterium]
MEIQLTILLAALVLDWYVGEPKIFWHKISHPVAWFGRVIEFLDQRMNNPSDASETQYRNGAVAWLLMVLTALVAGLIAQWLIGFLWWAVGWLVEVFIVSIFLAQKSLKDHVSAVADALRSEGVEGGRREIAKIVGRDPAELDASAICRAAIESLAENFSDGVVAPAFWYAIFGLPGLFVYKMINTADSMIAHRNEKYLHFGRVAAQADDLANWIPARLSAKMIILGAWLASGINSAREALDRSMSDAGLHSSPNAGWPEAAMAGAIGVSLGGKRRYGNETVILPYLNASGKMSLDTRDIGNALRIFTYASYLTWASVVIILVVFQVAG